LCLLLIDDAVWARKRSPVGRDSVEPSDLEPSADNLGSTESRPTIWANARRIVAVSALVVTLPINAMLIFSAFKPGTPWPRPLAKLGDWVEPFRIVNGYGLFRVMTKSRPEIVLEGSADGVDWLPYEFNWKPG